MSGDAWLCAWRELRRRKARAIVTVCGYGLAVAAVVVIQAAMQLSRRRADRVLGGTGTHFIAFVPASGKCPGCTIKRPEVPEEGFLAGGVAAALFPAGFVERIRKLPTVKDASPCLLYRFKDDKSGHAFTVGGFDVSNALAVRTTCCAATDVIAGRFLTAADRGGVMAEEAYARLRDLKVGDRIPVADRTFTVVGIVNPGIRPAKADIYMPFDEAREVISARTPPPPIEDEANVALVEVAAATVQDEAIRSVRALLPGVVVSSYACYKPASQVIGINERAAWLLTGALAAAALLLAAKTQWSWVLERRREIGILKAVGWTDRNVIAQILAESVLQAAAGSALGLLVAIGLLYALPGKAPGGVGAAGAIPVVLEVFAAAFGLVTAGGVLAGIGPAVAAARQRPAQALRTL